LRERKSTGGPEAGGVVEHHRFDAVVGGDETTGVEVDGVAGVEGADLEVPAADGQHAEPFGDHLAEADELADDVGAPAVGERADGRHTILRPRVVAEVDGGVGAHGAGQRQAVVEPVDHDDLMGAALLGHRGGVGAEPAGSLDDHRVAEADTDPFQAVVGAGR
jgi:hypothetical protein